MPTQQPKPTGAPQPRLTRPKATRKPPAPRSTDPALFWGDQHARPYRSPRNRRRLGGGGYPVSTNMIALILAAILAALL